MPVDFKFRKDQVKKLLTRKGVYVLCDLDEIPIYVGRTSEGIRRRAGRHLTSARSDVVANRQIDVWEIAYVWTYPCASKQGRLELESQLYHYYHPRSRLINGTVPRKFSRRKPPDPAQKVQVMTKEEIDSKRDDTQRLPRQAEHYAQLVGHFLSVKNSKQIALAMRAHFERLQKYHRSLLGKAIDMPDEAEER